MLKPTPRTFIALSALAAFSLGACGEKKNQDRAQPCAEETDTASSQGAAPSAPAGAPGKLQTIMMGLGEDMARLQAGLWRESYEVVGESATRIADHPKVSDDEKRRVMKALGDDFGAFVAMDRAVHDRAVQLAETAAREDLNETMVELSRLQKACVGCHTQFRARLVK